MTTSPGCSAPSVTSLRVPSVTPVVMRNGLGGGRSPRHRTSLAATAAAGPGRSTRPGTATRPAWPCPSELGEHFRGRMKAQRRVGDPDGVLPVRVHHGAVGRHAGLELELWVLDVDDGVVGDDVLHRLRRISNLPDAAGEFLVGVGIDEEGGHHPIVQLAHVRLGHRGVDLHLAKVLGDGEERGRGERGGHRLADVDGAGNDDAVDGGINIGVLEVLLGLLERGLRLLQLSLGGAGLRGGRSPGGFRRLEVRL